MTPTRFRCSDAVRSRAGVAALVLAAGLAVSAAAQPADQPDASEGQRVRKTRSALTMIKTGGPTLAVLGVCSVVTVTLIIERFMFYRRARGDAKAIVARVRQTRTLSEALAAVEHAPGVAGRVLRSAITAARDGYAPEHVEELVQGEVAEELSGLERYLPQLDTFVTMCPLIGLTGTTIGMIKSFLIVSEGFRSATELAGGISEALVNTAAGLLVAIPALFCYNWFTGRKEAILMDMEKGLSQLMVILKTTQPEVLGQGGPVQDA